MLRRLICLRSRCHRSADSACKATAPLSYQVQRDKKEYFVAPWPLHWQDNDPVPRLKLRLNISLYSNWDVPHLATQQQRAGSFREQERQPPETTPAACVHFHR